MPSSTLRGAARPSTKRNHHGQATKPGGSSKANVRRPVSAPTASPLRFSKANAISRGRSPIVTIRPSDQRRALSPSAIFGEPPIVGYTDALSYLLML
jgi:hypothetical protein